MEVTYSARTIQNVLEHGANDAKNGSMDTEEHMKMMSKMMQDKSHMAHDGQKSMMVHKKSVYNEALNTRQIDYPNVLGFNDLHIHAIRHLDVNQSHGTADHLLQTIIHHHCKVMMITLHPVCYSHME